MYSSIIINNINCEIANNKYNMIQFLTIPGFYLKINSGKEENTNILFRLLIMTENIVFFLNVSYILSSSLYFS